MKSPFAKGGTLFTDKSFPAGEFDQVLFNVEEMVTDGIITARDVDVVSYKTRGLLMPRHTRVREIMTPAPKKVTTTTPLSEVAKLLLSSTFTGLPVVDEENRPVGVIAQGDLVYKGGMPMRLGLLAESDREKVSIVLEALARKQAGEVMTQPAVIIAQDSLVTDAVKLMLNRSLKRLPVVDATGKLVGILSRVDVFRTDHTRMSGLEGLSGAEHPGGESAIRLRHHATGYLYRAPGYARR